MDRPLTIAGYLGTDPGMRFVPEGMPIVTFRMARPIRHRDAGGEQREETPFGRLAEIAHPDWPKGRPARMEERLGNPQIFRRADGTAGAIDAARARRVVFHRPRPEDGERPEG